MHRWLALLVVGAVACGGTEDGGAQKPAPEPESIEVFEHTPDAASGIATGDFGTPAAPYGTIAVPARFEHVLNFQMTPMLPPMRSAIPSSGPLILYSDDLDVMVFSPMDHFYESVVTFADGKITYGLEGEIDAVPEGFAHRFVLVTGRGIRRTLERWGDALLADRGKERTDRYADPGVATLGYWTDNGAYYYYRTEEGLNEEDTLLAVKADADLREIPLGYLQLDSWWYYKAGSGTNKIAGGMTEWAPKPEMFPTGLAAFQSALGLPLVVHNRWFAKDNVYRTDHEFVEGEEMALPLGRGVFDQLMADAKSWGVFTYEQDWLMLQFWGVPHLRNGVGHAEDWVKNIHDAAVDVDLTVQLTMPGAAHLMHTVDLPGVTSLRTSIDYAPTIAKHGFWPQFHIVNLLARSLGVLPFKDNFHSSERFGEAEALVSISSAGMVGPSDQLGKMDRDILLRTCRSDGRLLKPDVPAVPIDAMFLAHSRPFTTVTHSEHGGARWTYVAGYLMSRETLTIADNIFLTASYDGQEPEEHYPLPERVTDFSLDLEDDLEASGRYVVWDWRAKTARVADRTVTTPKLEEAFDHSYVVLAPVFANGLALIGETGKYITVADQRFERIEAVSESIEVDLLGAAGEGVTLTAYDADAKRELDPVTITIGPGGRATAKMSR